MPTTAKILYDCCLRDECPPIPVVVDYFGNSLDSEMKQGLVLGVYEGLVKTKGVSVELLDNCFRTNRLNQLVHEKYKRRPSPHYKMFCKASIDLNASCALLEETEGNGMKIYDDNFCPNCETEGYITERFGAGYIDCEKCLQLMCQHCCGDYGKCKTCNETERKE